MRSLYHITVRTISSSRLINDRKRGTSWPPHENLSAMSNSVRNGFSTLNRFLGKKNKDMSMSKSVSNLSTLDSSSQHNKIIPLAASNNAPFEQTFRITICLPREQLYVVRVGARTKLRQLLETVCASKQLDRDKFEFRHPDGTQTYDNEMTIGEVGLNEIRLADKNDKTYIKFNTDELMKLRHMSRESLTSSSDFSKGSNKQSYSKTISPYSSTNSLNSMDSATGTYNHSYNNRNSLQHPPVAPMRKKRVAPRPPSQNSINENQVVETVVNSSNAFKKPITLPRKKIHVSTPNLNGNNNNDTKFTLINNNNNNILNKNIEESEERRETVDVKLRNGSQLNHSRTTSESSEYMSPNKRTSSTSSARKKAAPAPPPKVIIPVSLITIASEPTRVEKVTTPIHVPASISTSNPNISKVMLNVEPPIDNLLQESSSNVIDIDSRDLPSTTPSSPTNTTDEPRSLESKTDSSDEDETKIYNIKTGKPITIQEPVTKAKSTQSATVTEVPNTETFKESPSARPIVEAPTSPVVNKSLTLIQNTSEPSSRAESPLWTYTLPAPPKFADSELDPSNRNQTMTTTDHPDFFNGESLVGSSDTATVISDLSDLSDVPIKPIIKERMPLDFQVFNDASTIGEDIQSVTASDAEDGYQGFNQRFSREALLESLERRREQFIESEFKFLTTEEPVVSQTHPIDSSKPEERREVEGGSKNNHNETNRKVSIESKNPNVIEELKEAIVKPKLDPISKTNDRSIVGSDPTVLSNFSINAYSNNIKPKVAYNNLSNSNHKSEGEEYTIKRINPTKESENTGPGLAGTESNSSIQDDRRPSLSNGISRINRSDSFHSTRTIDPTANTPTTQINGLTPRSSSYISLIGTQKFENRTFKSQFSDSTMRRNSSELSIADSPSLQSLSVMKSILSNSRKNSLNNDGAAFSNTDVVVEPAKPVEPVVLKRNTSITDINKPMESAPSVADNRNILQSKPLPQEIPIKQSNNVNVTITQLNADTSPASAPEKKWRYQGPPAVSMSTWGERPKTAINIKSDKDYKSNDTQAPTKILPNNGFKKASEVAPKSIVVHPSPVTEHDRTPIIRGLVPKSTAQTTATTDETSNISIRRPSYEISTYIVDKPLPETKIASNTMTLGRVSIPNRWSTLSKPSSSPVSISADSNIAAASAVQGFKVSDPVNSHTSTTTINAPQKNTKNYAIAKDGSFDSGYKSMPPVYSELTAAKLAQAETEPAATAPFSQFTLRKTGLKDKILADPTARNVTKPPAQSATVVSNTTVHLRSHNGNGQVSQRPFTVPTFNAPHTLADSVDVAKKVTPLPNTSHVSNPPPPPPPSAAGLTPPVIRAVTTKKPPVTSVNPRDQLMDAIRNFGQNGGLKKM